MRGLCERKSHSWLWVLRDRASRTEDVFQKVSEEEVGEAEGKVLRIGIPSEGGSNILEFQEGLEKLP